MLFTIFDESHHTSSLLRAPDLTNGQPDPPLLCSTTDTPTHQVRPGFDHPFVPYFSVVRSAEDGDAKGGGIRGVDGCLYPHCQRSYGNTQQRQGLEREGM